MASTDDDMDIILKKIYDVIYNETKIYFEEYTKENIKGTIWSIYDNIIDTIRCDVRFYADGLAERILEECKRDKYGKLLFL